MPAKQSGVTVIELLITLFLVSILLALSLPAFGELNQNSQMNSTRSELFLALNLARSRAVTSQSDVVLCPSSDQFHCLSNSSWKKGWIVFQDHNHNGEHDANEALFLMHPALTSGIAITTGHGRPHITYRPDGSATGNNLTFTFCDRRGLAKAHTIVVNNGGRARQGTPTQAQAAAACTSL